LIKKRLYLISLLWEKFRRILDYEKANVVKQYFE